MKPKVLITNWVHPEIERFLETHCTVVANPDRDKPFTRERILAEGEDLAALLTFMPDSVDDELLAALPNLRVVSCALKGFDNFDVNACTRHGIWITIVPDLLTEPTAELAIGLMISVARNIGAGDSFMRSGAYRGWRARFYGTGLSGSTLTLIGIGAVGRAIARRLSGFGTNTLYVDQLSLDPAKETELKLQKSSLEDALPLSDFVVLGLPLTDATERLFDAAMIARMKPGSFLINPARGSLVVEDAVADALETGHLAGYAADVFEMEDWARTDRPHQVSQRLLDNTGNTCLTPHIGSAVDSVRREIAMEAAVHVVQALEGRRPDGAVNSIDSAQQMAAN